jgi:hypothetical protein
MDKPEEFFNRLSHLEAENCWQELEESLKPTGTLVIARITSSDLLAQEWTKAEKWAVYPLEGGQPDWEKVAGSVGREEADLLKGDFTDFYGHLVVLYSGGQFVTSCEAPL